jgi:hypothetical protein
MAGVVMFCCSCGTGDRRVTAAGATSRATAHPATTQAAVAMDTSEALSALAVTDVGEASARMSAAEERRASMRNREEDRDERRELAARRRSGQVLAPFEEDTTESSPRTPRSIVPPGSANVEQTSQGTRAAATIVASFDGLGTSFRGPQGTATLRNPSDNTLAVGPNHIVQLVNSRMAIFTKGGSRYDTTGRVLDGPVASNNVFRGFGGPCEERLSGDAVARYDQLAHRWLIVLPIFARVRKGEQHAPPLRAGEGARESERGQTGHPGEARQLFEPPPPTPAPDSVVTGAARAPAPPRVAPDTQGVYAMCYALSTSDDPLGSYYRYEFIRPLFPDYPRPAVWPDGYYLPTSTGDDVIQKHACVVDRVRMLAGEPATEQCVIVDGVNFLNSADLDGTALPPAGAPNPVLAAGGTQLQ